MANVTLGCLTGVGQEIGRILSQLCSPCVSKQKGSKRCSARGYVSYVSIKTDAAPGIDLFQWNNHQQRRYCFNLQDKSQLDWFQVNCHKEPLKQHETTEKRSVIFSIIYLLHSGLQNSQTSPHFQLCPVQPKSASAKGKKLRYVPKQLHPSHKALGIPMTVDSPTTLLADDSRMKLIRCYPMEGLHEKKVTSAQQFCTKKQ